MKKWCVSAYNRGKVYFSNEADAMDYALYLLNEENTYSMILEVERSAEK